MKRWKEIVGIALATLLLSSPAVTRAGAATDSIPGYRSPGTAVLLSTLGTVVPVAVGLAVTGQEDRYGRKDDTTPALLIWSGYLIGPSLGHFYAGRPGRAFAGVGIRALATVAVGAAIAATWNEESSAADALGVAGLVTGAYCTIYDIAQAGHSAKVTNEKLAARVSVEPTVISNAPGVGVSVTF